MSITTEIRRTVAGARATLTDAKPLHAVAGAGDLLVERVRTTAAAQQRALQSLRADPTAVPARVNATVDGVRSAIAGLPEHAQGVVVGTAGRANRTYDGLARRGATLVGRIRRQSASQELADQVQNTVRAAKATTTTARNAGAATRRRVRATATSARKATSAAGAATSSAATKTGATAALANATPTPVRTSPAKRGTSATATKRTASPRKTSPTATKRTASPRKTSPTATKRSAGSKKVSPTATKRSTGIKRTSTAT